MTTKHLFQQNKTGAGGQSSLEFGILLVIIISAILAMQVYLKRGMQGRLRENIESIGGQYDPQATNSEYSFCQVSSSTTTTKVEPKQVTIRTYDPVNPSYYADTTATATVSTTEIQTHYDNSVRTGWEHVGNAI